MHKIYVLVDEWVREFGESSVNVVGAYTDRKSAEKALEDQIKLIKKEDDCKFDTEDYCKGDYYEAYNAGFYGEAHDHTFIQEVELK